MRRLIALAFLTIFVTASADAQFLYTVKDLGTLGGSNSAATAISNNAQVAGSSYLFGDEVQNAFVTEADGGTPIRGLGTLGGSDSFGQAINANGQVAGISKLVGDLAFRAFLSDANGGAISDLGTLGGSHSYGYGVNFSGQVAGYSTTTDALTHAYITGANGAGMLDLGTLAGGTFSFGYAVNASGQVAGYSGTSNGNRAFLSDPNGGALHGLATLGGRYSVGLAVNDNGQVAGRSEVTTGGQHAFRSDVNGGALLDLGTLGGLSSIAEGINSAGSTVGYSYIGDNSTLHAFLYTNTEGLRDLNSLLVASNGWVLMDARSINDYGEITGYGSIAGASHAFLLTPVLPGLRATLVTKINMGQTFVMRVEGVGVPSRNHTVEATADLTQPFVAIATVVAANDGTLRFDDSSAGTLRRRYYRFVYP